MNMPSVDGYMQAAVWMMIVKVSLLLAMGATVQAVLRRRTSSATRHLIWTLTIVGLLLLPMLSAVMPAWKLPIGLVTTTASQSEAIVIRVELASPLVTVRDTGASSPAVGNPATLAPMAAKTLDIPWPIALLALYAAGVLILVARLVAEQVAIRRLARRATAVNEPELIRLLIECAQYMAVRRPVRLLRSREHTMPMLLGTRIPAIVLPAMADTWSHDRRRTVLLHELAHVARSDCQTQMATAVACALYWIHPGVWWIARCLRVDRELACDDRVLAAGTDGREYAVHLLEIAYSVGGCRAPAVAVSTGHPRQLERRILAVLDNARNRAAPALRGRVAAIAIMALLLVPLAGADPTVVPNDGDSPRLVHVSSTVDESPTSTIQSIEFVGNQAIGSSTLKRQMKRTKERSIWQLFAGRSTYQEARFREDVERILKYYRDHGYITARIGEPELLLVRESADKRTRLLVLRITVVEGNRYKVGDFAFDGNNVVASDALRPMFKIERGMFYKEKTIRDGIMKAREVYRANGYVDFTGYPDFKLRDRDPIEPTIPQPLSAEPTKLAPEPPIVDVTIRLQEGKRVRSTVSR